MNNFAYGTIAGLQKAHYGTTTGTVFEKNGKPYSPDYAAIAQAYGIDGVRIESADQFKPALEAAIKANVPYVLDVIMENAPVPTAGHWNIMDIYSPGQKGPSRFDVTGGKTARSPTSGPNGPILVGDP